MGSEQTKHIVVLGAGFGGLTFCQKLAAPGVRITLVDRQNHHLFQPLLYQVATAGLSATEIAQPVRAILSDKREVTVLMDEVVGVDLAARSVQLNHNRLEYDYLVMALGGVTSYFGHPEWEPFAPGLKSLDDALRIRRDILHSFEEAENLANENERARRLTTVVVGGGPTGVEMAGAIAELARRVLRQDFRRIDPGRARVVLVEGGPRVLGHFRPDLSAKAQRSLERLGVQVLLGQHVQEIRQGEVRLPDRTIEADNIVWAAGVSANPLGRTLGVEVDRAGRVAVQPDLSIAGHPEAFVIGDMAAVRQADGSLVPGVSPAAMQMARHVARTIATEALGRPQTARGAFRYRDKGTMATIGRSAAVAQLAGVGFSGWLAWCAWLLVHLVFLIGFRNRLAVLIQWAYAYFTYRRGARIITGLNSGEEPGGPKPPAPALLRLSEKPDKASPSLVRTGS